MLLVGKDRHTNTTVMKELLILHTRYHPSIQHQVVPAFTLCMLIFPTEPEVEVQFVQPSYTVNETSGVARVCVQTNSGNTNSITLMIQPGAGTSSQCGSFPEARGN